MTNTFNKKPKTTIFIVTLILLTVLFLLIETVLRFTHFTIYVTKGQSNFPSMFEADDIAGFDFVENFKHGIHSVTDVKYTVHSNNIGCYDDPVELNKKYNVIIGDSFTWGFSPLDKKWTSILQKNTQQRFIKCGVLAYGPIQALNKLKKINRLIGEYPKTIIFGYYWNDLNDDYTHPAQTVLEGNSVNRIKTFNYETGEVHYLDEESIRKNYDEFQKHGHPQYSKFNIKDKIKFWIKSHSIIANLVHNTAATLSATSHDYSIQESIVEGSEARYATYLAKMNPEKYPWLDKAWEKHLNNLKAISDTAKSLNSKFLIVIMPTKINIYPHLAKTGELPNLKQSRKRLMEFLKQENISFIDLYPEFTKARVNGAKLYLPNDLHFNAQGEALAGKVISDAVIKRKFLE